MEQVIANGFYLGAQYALIALGLTLIFALMNVLNFAHGQMYVLGGFITYTIYGQWPLAAFEVTGEYATYDNDSFCRRCGSRLFLIDEEWGGVELQLGSLDDAPFELRPEAEIWIKRREPWMHEVEGASQHGENRH